MFSDCFITSWKVRENAKLTWEHRHTGWLLTLPGKPGNPGKGGGFRNWPGKPGKAENPGKRCGFGNWPGKPEKQYSFQLVFLGRPGRYFLLVTL